ncbi:DUF6491 family protein [Luteimonas sp. MC1828]|uniref:DUF6491 family protein n=1 Tax=Luteimonas sp. MC1828 TaxID=2799787 RepID=UPI0018F1FD66|nr:DUF6491 family protein [Luteimonas sp. MC1828]MBJ7574351.1 hypothetical protein [Luteimonas sp. MC1828]
MSTKTIARMGMALAAVLLVSGCATGGGVGAAEKLAIYRAAAGSPVNSFPFHGSITGWTPLGDGAIALWTGPRRAWLLDLDGPCPDIDYTPVIAVTSSQAGRVSARFDKVLASGQGSMQIPCRISEIRPLDTSKVKAAEKAAREDQEASSGT